ncbi:MAG: hypothetical protein P9L92_08755 [Candidatus Electryonea clarkiae]|nr:hypothetical protein [Candidatus Electryonea clarkiae]MDP8289204.1 hypothetical protein [Candidatus Electryonea clarkiae]
MRSEVKTAIIIAIVLTIFAVLLPPHTITWDRDPGWAFILYKDTASHINGALLLVELILIWGISLAIGFLTSKKEPKSSSATESYQTQNLPETTTTTCPSCGKVYQGDASGLFCEDCGMSL